LAEGDDRMLSALCHKRTLGLLLGIEAFKIAGQRR
jgi:hypothetical protein